MNEFRFFFVSFVCFCLFLFFFFFHFFRFFFLCFAQFCAVFYRLFFFSQFFSLLARALGPQHAQRRGQWQQCADWCRACTQGSFRLPYLSDIMRDLHLCSRISARKPIGFMRRCFRLADGLLVVTWA